jgi:hypothetical protein
MGSLDRPREPSEGDGPRRTTDEAMSRLGVLHGAANAHHLRTEISTADGGENYYVRLDRRPLAPARVFCAERAGDDGRLWFYGDGGEWITEALEPVGITAALTWLKGKQAEADRSRQAEADDEREVAEGTPLERV